MKYNKLLKMRFFYWCFFINVEKVILDVLGYSLIDIPDLSKTPTKSPSKVPTKNPNTPPPPFKITATYSAALLAHLQTTQIQAAITAAIEAYQNIILSTGTASIAFDLSSSVGNKFLWSYYLFIVCYRHIVTL